jgi:hypothetical protein
MPNKPTEAKGGVRLSPANVLNALLSVTFLVLAAYIAWSSTLVATAERNDLRWFSALVGAYGVWRLVRTAIRARKNGPE